MTRLKTCNAFQICTCSWTTQAGRDGSKEIIRDDAFGKITADTNQPYFRFRIEVGDNICIVRPLVGIGKRHGLRNLHNELLNKSINQYKYSTTVSATLLYVNKGEIPSHK